MEVFSWAMLMKLCICLEICLSSRFMSVVLWPGMTHLVSRLSQNACSQRRAWCHSQLWDFFLSLSLFNKQLDNSYITPCSKLSRGYSFCPLWCLCQKLSLSLLYFNKTWLHKKLWQPSLITGHRLNASLLEAKNPSMIHRLLFTAATFHIEENGSIFCVHWHCI